MIIGSGVRTCFPRFPSSSEKHVLRSAVKFTFTIQRPRRPFTTACSVSAPKKEKVIVVSGPTGAGKSRLALELAKLLNGEIISADSVQVWAKTSIPSSKLWAFVVSCLGTEKVWKENGKNVVSFLGDWYFWLMLTELMSKCKPKKIRKESWFLRNRIALLALKFVLVMMHCT